MLRMCEAYLNPAAGRPVWHIAGRNIVNPDKTRRKLLETSVILQGRRCRRQTSPARHRRHHRRPHCRAAPSRGSQRVVSLKIAAAAAATAARDRCTSGRRQVRMNSTPKICSNAARSSIPASWWCRPAQRRLAVFAGRQPQIASSDSHWRHRKRISIWNTECRRLHWQAPPPRRQPQPRTALHWPSAGRLTASARDFRRCGSAPASRRRPGSPRTPAGAVTA